MSIKDKIWLFGHPTNSLYGTFKLDKESFSTPVGVMKEMGIDRIIYVPYKHQTDKKKELPLLQENCKEYAWSIEDVDDVDELIDYKKKYPKLSFGLFDDFLNPENERNIDYFTIDGLKKIKEKLNQNGIEMWMVYYEKQIDIDISPYLDLFDGITFWFWKEPSKEKFEETIDIFFNKTKGKKRMVGVYLYNFGMRLNADPEMVIYQLNRHKEFIEEKKLDGIILHNSAIADMGFKAYDEAIKWLNNL